MGFSRKTTTVLATAVTLATIFELSLVASAEAQAPATNELAPAAAAASKVLIPVVKPTVEVPLGDRAVNVAKAATYCRGYEHAGTAKEFIDFPGYKFGQLMVFKNFDTGKLCITQLAVKRVQGTSHQSTIELFEADCITSVKEVHANVKTKLVTLKFQPRLGQPICIEGSNSVTLDPTQPTNVTVASGSLVVNFI